MSVFLEPGDCSEAQPCTGGLACVASRCVESDQNPILPGPGFDPNEIDASAPAPVDGNPSTCADIDVKFDKIVPEVRLLIDQSWSMQTNNYGTTTRWNALRDALMNPTTGVVKRLEGDVSFGLALYSYAPNAPNIALPPGVTADSSCPRLFEANASINSYNSLNALYSTSAPRGATPTGESLLRVAGVNYDRSVVPGGFADQNLAGPKIVVLATDGDPNTCNGPYSVGTAAGRSLSLDAVNRLFEKGIRTYVVAVGDDVSEDHQRAIANAGVGMGVAGNAKLYRPTNPDALVASFNEIIYGARACVFKLRGEVVAGTEAKGRVSLDGRALTSNDANGWRLNNSTEIELLGSACNALRTTANPALTVSFPCGSIVIR